MPPYQAYYRPAMSQQRDKAEQSSNRQLYRRNLLKLTSRLRSVVDNRLKLFLVGHLLIRKYDVVAPLHALELEGLLTRFRVIRSRVSPEGLGLVMLLIFL
ncbi:hypothetical protein S245_052961, partial [Arachis hypogaea]